MYRAIQNALVFILLRCDPQEKYPAARLRASGSVRYDAFVSARKIMSEAWNLTTAFGYVAM